jgi:hypothetical protein
MTILDDRTSAQRPTTCRISFRQPVSRTGSIDAAWWPRSNDLAAELPALLEVFWTAGREMTRVSYHLESWTPAPRKLRIAGRLIRAGGYHYGSPHQMTVTDDWRKDSADLLVIPFDTDPAIAERELATAAEAGNLLTAQQMIERATA